MSKDIKKLNINEVASEDFLTYATEVIRERAIPNIEDNLKPVHRRILYTLFKTKLTSDAKHKKSAATVGETMKSHPHGDSSIYDAMIRLGQDWKMRYPLVDIQGNVGNINGSSAAASRYTEAKLSPIGDLMVEELSYKPVPYADTYDGDSQEPILLPSLFPNILCNGNMGIAVGMSSSILPHNLREVSAAIEYYLDHPDMSIDDLVRLIPGPDLPTGGTITNISKIKEIYQTGKGTLEIEGKYRIEDKGREKHIVFTEIPYMVNIEDIILKVKELFQNGELDDLTDIQNNTGRSGIEIRIILKPKANVNKNLEILFSKTGLRSNTRIGLTVLRKNKPIQANMFDLLDGFIEHRHSVLTIIHQEKKEKAENRLHVVEGMMIAVKNIDEVVEMIKRSDSRNSARDSLINTFNLTIVQANAILDMKLSQLTKIDADKLAEEKNSLIIDIKKYTLIIEDKKQREVLIKNSIKDISAKFGDPRRTVLKNLTENETKVDLELIVSLLPDNVLEAVETSSIATGTKGKKGKKIFEKEPIRVIHFNTKNDLIVVSKKGYISKISGKFIQEGQVDIDKIINIQEDDEITLIKEYKDEYANKEFFVSITKNNMIKKTKLSEYKLGTPTVAAKIKEDDEIISFAFSNDDDNVVVTGENKINRYKVKEISSTGKNTLGVKASPYSKLDAAEICSDDSQLLVVDSEGNAKKIIAKDIIQSARINKGNLSSENTSIISVFGRTNSLIFSKEMKGFIIDLDELEIKSPKLMNNKIHGDFLFDFAR